MIEIRNLSKSFIISKKETTILNDISYKFPEKGLVVIVGKSGCGKSTLLKLIAMDDKNYKGDIYFDDINAKELDNNFIKNNIIFITSENNLLSYLTVKENLQLMLQDKYLEGLELVDKYNLKSLLDKKAKKLSSGEIQKVCLVIALVLKRRITILDEPIRNIEASSTKMIINDIKALSDVSLVICVSHFEKDFDNVSSFLLRIEDGKLHEEKNIQLSDEKVCPTTFHNDVIKYSFKTLKKNKIIPLSFHIFFYALMYAMIFFFYLGTFKLNNMIDVSLKNDLNHFYFSEEYNNQYQCLNNLRKQYAINAESNLQSFAPIITIEIKDKNNEIKIDHTIPQIAICDNLNINGNNVKILDDTIYCSDYFLNEILNYDEKNDHGYIYCGEEFAINIKEYKTDYIDYLSLNDNVYKEKEKLFKERENLFYSVTYMNKSTFDKIALNFELKATNPIINDKKFEMGIINNTFMENKFKIENDNECLLNNFAFISTFNLDINVEELDEMISNNTIMEYDAFANNLGKTITFVIEDNGKKITKNLIFKGIIRTSTNYFLCISNNLFDELVEYFDYYNVDNLYANAPFYQIDFTKDDYNILKEDVANNELLIYMKSQETYERVFNISIFKPYALMGFGISIVVILLICLLYYFIYLKSDWEKISILKYKGFNKKEVLVYNYFPTIFIHLVYMSILAIVFVFTYSSLINVLF